MRKNNKAIGGYFELEIPTGESCYHDRAIKLNTARNALEFIVESTGLKKIYLPEYVCRVLYEPLDKLKVQYEAYHVNNLFEIVGEITLEAEEMLLCVNYFGLKDSYIEKVAVACGAGKLIVDNSQSFFSRPVEASHSIYSPRKYFGVPDGAFLYTDTTIARELERDVSGQRLGHLVGRVEYAPELYYEEFRKNDGRLSHQKIKKMSRLTEKLLMGLDYRRIRSIREKNHGVLESRLGDLNALAVATDSTFGYPLLLENGERIRAELIDERIFIPTYWTDGTPDKLNDEERHFRDNLLLLPTDQRYGRDDMERLAATVKRVCRRHD